MGLLLLSDTFAPIMQLNLYSNICLLVILFTTKFDVHVFLSILKNRKYFVQPIIWLHLESEYRRNYQFLLIQSTNNVNLIYSITKFQFVLLIRFNRFIDLQTCKRVISMHVKIIINLFSLHLFTVDNLIILGQMLHEIISCETEFIENGHAVDILK